MNFISVEKFGKDHWSLLGYVETCCVDKRGEINYDKIRINPNCNPQFGCRNQTPRIWKNEYSTRLKTFPWKSKDEKEKAKHRILGHDDLNCLADLEQAGFINMISYVNGLLQITSTGLTMAAELRAHKANGGSFSNFTPVGQRIVPKR